jgi:hypothetical protein
VSKDDFLGNKTLWLDSASMAVARERFFKAWLASLKDQDLRHATWQTTASQPINATVTTNAMPVDEAQRIWTVAWAAAVAAYSYVMQGNLGPAEDEPKGDAKWG